MSTDRPEPRPEGALIAAALKRSPLSVREAASRVGISDGRWYQIIRGYQTISSGVYAPVKGPADTVARMAEVVGVTAEQLDEADRPDAAEELRALTPDEEPADDRSGLRAIEGTGISAAEVLQIADRLEAEIAELRARIQGTPPAEEEDRRRRAR